MDLIGTVKNVNREKGFGFITPDDRQLGKDVFFHKTSVENGLWGRLEDRRTRVACSVEDTDKGLRATAVRAL